MASSQNSGTISLPKLQWKRATCVVCGESFDYTGKRRPSTCKKGECRYKFEFNIKPETWANHQPDLLK